MGKASIIYVMGLGFIVGYALLNINTAGTDAITNYTNYYNRTVSRNIAFSGANIGTADLFFDSTYKTPYKNVDFQSGKMNVWFEDQGWRKLVWSTGTVRTYNGKITDTVIADLRRFNLARYAWFTDSEANRGGQITTWRTGDTCWGPVHTNDKFNIFGQPVFMRKATAAAAAVPKPNIAEWRGGYQWGITVPYPTNFNEFLGAAIGGGRVIPANATLTFNADGSVRLQTALVDTTFGTTLELAPNGAFLVQGGNLQVSGVVDGDLAIGAAPLAGIGGNVFITSDIRYKDDPRLNPGSNDKLGIYAINDITVTYDNADPSAYQNRMIDASIFSVNGEFNVQEYNKWAPRGVLSTYGCMMQKYRGAIGVWNPGGLLHGYDKGFRYDDRLYHSPPKYFPAMGRFTLYAWWEN